MSLIGRKSREFNKSSAVIGWRPIYPIFKNSTLSVFRDLISEKSPNKRTEHLLQVKNYCPIMFPQCTNPLGGFGSFPKKFIQRRHEEAPPIVAKPSHIPAKLALAGEKWQRNQQKKPKISK